ncbi:MAG: hypothetical protein OSJ72_02030 [Lachnospiraceae bacterium]|nr:hypothetical protein [Lachnospiraceae bacterium]
MSKIGKRCENWILTFLAMGISALLMAFFFDFYFDINDDTLMRDIMSGIYSGTPDGHNMQTLYPLGAVIALCYQINGSFPWYGAFLFLCQFGCFFAVGVRLCTLIDVAGTRRKFAWKLLCLLGLVLFQWGMWLTHMVNVQYTITSGMLVGTAVFLFLTMPRGTVKNVSEGGSETSLVKDFLVGSLPSLLLFLLAFQLRSEMALLVLPFLGLAGVFCWWEDRPVVTGKNLKKYGGLFLLLLAGMGLSLGADALAYGGEWKEFRQFFDDRTTIYDFYPEVVTDDAYAADLDEMGAWYGARLLLENYNYGLDEKVDAQLLADVAAYAKERVGGARDWGRIFREKLLLYRYRSFHGGDAPYNMLVGLAYAANIIAAVTLFCGKAGRRHGELCGVVVRLLLVFVVRTALWMFILLRGRDPERIIHPLYLVEFCLLAGMFLHYLRGTVVTGPVAKAVDAAAAALCLLSVAFMIKAISTVQADQVRRQEINADWEAIDAYCRERPDTFYFEDVYSTVAFSGKLLECRDNTFSNYDIAGGWMCKSPLYREKLAAFGIENAVDALAQGRADFIMSDEEISLRGLVWLEIPFALKEMSVYIEEYDRIGENYGVYQIIPISENGEGEADGCRRVVSETNHVSGYGQDRNLAESGLCVEKLHLSEALYQRGA